MTQEYQEALDFIFTYVDYEKQARFTYDAATLNLDRVYRLLALLGNPQNHFKSIHIAGTKGKGSTAAMTEAILRAAGLRTGLYTSPHLHTFRERIRVGGELLSQQALIDLVNRCQPAIEAVEVITTFEIITVLCFMFFALEKIEWAVIETGLGGRLDATNVITPEITAITTLSLDHTYLLGDTIAQLASEKAGIVKPGVPIVCAPQPPEAFTVIEQVCREREAPLIKVGRDWMWQRTAAGQDGQTFDVSEVIDGEPTTSAHTGLRIPLLGRFQLLNATMAVSLIETLKRNGLQIDSAAIRQGLASTRWPGRLELLLKSPMVLVDCAHNPDSVTKLATAVRDWYPHRKLSLIYGASEDKDVGGMLDALAPIAHHIICATSRHPRAADARSLARQVVSRLAPGQTLGVSSSVGEALQHAIRGASAKDLVLATGSIFLVGEVREALSHALPSDDWVHEAEPIVSVK